ncbi:MAG: amidase family protein, partial [Acidimicrobiales bacterium]
AVHPGAAVPFTMLGNLAWNPAVSVPAGMTSANLPIGLQIMGKAHCDDVVLRLALVLERANPWPAVAPGWAGSP